jgi:hypothetical protein
MKINFVFRPTYFTRACKKIQPGLSVWMWGPTFWDILHSVAYVSDTLHIFSKEEMTNFYTLLQPLLPCRYCRDSYGGFLQEAIQKKCMLGEACERMQLGLLVYDVHERVNRKLLLGKDQKFEKLKAAVIKNAGTQQLPLGMWDFFDTETVWSCLNSQPSLMILYKRGLFFEHEPMKLDATWLLVLALSQRITDETTKNFSVFLAVLAKTLQSLPFRSSKEMARLLVVNQYSELFSNYTRWITLQCTVPPDETELMKKTQQKLSIMVSGACGAGTCK